MLDTGGNAEGATMIVIIITMVMHLKALQDATTIVMNIYGLLRPHAWIKMLRMLR